MAFNVGYYQTDKRRVNVLRGFDGADPKTYTQVAPVTDDTVIKSGQLVTLVADAWVLYDAVNHKGKTPYVALSHSDDTDVSSSGLLPALSCAGKFEIETPYFDAGTYNTDTVIVGSTTDGNIAAQADPETPGTIDIIGFATRGGESDLNSGFPKAEVMAKDSSVVTFVTNWQVARASA